MRVIIKGVSEKEVESRIKYLGPGWEKVAPIRPHPDRWIMESKSAFVCVVENKNPKKKRGGW